VSVTDATHVVMNANATATGSNLTFTVSTTTTPITIQGLGFGGAQGSVLLERIAPLTGTIALGTITHWDDRLITLSVPSTLLSSAAPYHLVIRTAATVSLPSQDALNTVTFHVIGSGYNPTVYEVGPGKTFQPDHAVDANGIPAVPFKGPALAASVYLATIGPHGLRDVAAAHRSDSVLLREQLAQSKSLSDVVRWAAEQWMRG
jgi:hypothetical protein